jgi:hypothetical protein
MTGNFDFVRRDDRFFAHVQRVRFWSTSMPRKLRSMSRANQSVFADALRLDPDTRAELDEAAESVR